MMKVSIFLLFFMNTLIMMSPAVVSQDPPPLCSLVPFCKPCCWCIPEGETCPDIDNRRLPLSFGSLEDHNSEITKIATLIPNEGSLVDFDGPDNCQPFPDVAEFLGVEVCDEPTGKTSGKKKIRGRQLRRALNKKKGKKNKKKKKDDDDDSKVCLFVFDKGQEECGDRETYSLKTTKLSSSSNSSSSKKNKKIQDRAVVTHQGACGVCSSAKDLVANLNPALNIYAFICGNIIPNGWIGLGLDKDNPPMTETLLQAAQNAFLESVTCFEEFVGFSPSCAKLYASDAANSALNDCTDSCQAYIEACLGDCYDGSFPLTVEQQECLDDPTNAQQIAQCAVFGLPPNAPGGPSPGIFFPPGSCNLNTCLLCDEDESGDTFAVFGGRTRRSSGLVTVSDQVPVDPADPTQGLIPGAFVGLKRDCNTVANIRQNICGTLDDGLDGFIEI